MKIFSIREILPKLPDLFLRRRLSFSFEQVPLEAKALTLKKIGNFFMAGLNQYILPSRPLGYPVIAQVEPVNFCNLSCPLCLTVSQNASRPRSRLSLDTFKTFIDETGEYLLLIVLWNWGEPFLHPDILRIIEYAKSKNIVVYSSTNGNVKLDDDQAEKIVDSGLDSLVFAVDGATQETYGKYRKGGNLQLLLSNIKTIVKTKKRKKSETPLINMRFVAMRHNEKELPQMKQLAEELAVDYFTIKTAVMHPSIGQTLDKSYVPENPRYRMYEYEAEGYHRKQKPFTCMRPWKRITIDSSGEIISCEYDYRNLHSFGNLKPGRSSLSIWKGHRARTVRNHFNLGNNDFYHCKDCVYKNRAADDCTVEKISISQR